MARLSNSPQQQLVMDLERRKSYSFRVVIMNADRSPMNLSDCTLRFVMKAASFDDDLFDTTNQIINCEAQIDSPELGEATFSFQAAELDAVPGEYNYTIVMWTKTGFSVVVVKGILNLHPNTESASALHTYSPGSTDGALEITMRGSDVVNIVVNTLTQSTVRQDIVGVGRPDDPSTLEAKSIQAVNAAAVGTLFISLDGSGEGMWAWRKRRNGWALIEGKKPEWAELVGKPATYPPDVHTHLWAHITDKPALYPPSAHGHTWGEISGKPAQYQPSAHTHDWAEVTGRPSTYTPTAHTHPWAEVTGKPSSFVPAAHMHPVTELSTTNAADIGKFLRGDGSWQPAPIPSWSEVTGKPSTFTPAVHTHELSELVIAGTPDNTTFLRGDGTWAGVSGAGGTANWPDILNKPTEFPPAPHTHPISAIETSNSPTGDKVLSGSGAWVEQVVEWPNVINPPTFYPAEPHTHPWSEVTGKPSTFAPSTHSHAWDDITGKPSTFTPATHSHAWSAITSKPSTFTPAAHTHAAGDITNFQAYTIISAGDGWVTFGDGTMIVYTNRTVTMAMSTAYGSFFLGEYTWVYGRTFIDPPAVTVGQMQWGSSASWGQCKSSATANATLRCLDIQSRASGPTYIQAMAVGRWK